MCKSAYIHIPFCKSKCRYCSFISGTDLSKIFDYIESVCSEIQHLYEGEKLNTIYFGGGTPSLLPVEGVNKILGNLNFDESTEITFEMNPDDTREDYLKELRSLGVNRLSIGSQTFDDNILNLIGRRHNSDSVINAVKLARKTGFGNISLDLIYGLPEQTTELLKKDLEIIKELDAEHVSTYGLKIEEPSYFSKNRPANIPDDDAQADMYILINQMLNADGYKRYEISNFAKPGYESKHNLNYWNNTEYYGFGLAAHGYKNGVRYSNSTSLEEYLKKPFIHEVSHNVTKKEQIEEEIFLGFRRDTGIDSGAFYKKYQIDFGEKYRKVLEKYVPDFIEETNSGYKLTTKGILLSNLILSEFLD